MNCFGYDLCFVFKNKENVTKFYIPAGDGESLVQLKKTNNILTTEAISNHNFYYNFKRPVSTRNKAVRFIRSNFDIVPKSCSSGDWIMRYANSDETNFNPWGGGGSKFSFDLVPWRHQKKRIDLMDAIGWERHETTETNDKSIVHLTKRLVKRNRKLLTERLKHDDHGASKRFFKIKIIFSIEFHKKMQILQANCSVPTKTYINNNQQVFVFDPSIFQLSEKWQGYFSKRQTEDFDTSVKETQAIQLNANQQLDYRILFSDINQLYLKDNVDSAFKPVPCAQCINKRFVKQAALSNWLNLSAGKSLY